MRAVVLTAYGDPDALEVRDVDAPEPAAGQIRVAVHVTTVTAGDAELRRGDLPWLFLVPLRLWMGWSRPRASHAIQGMELAGVVDAVGAGVDRFAVGDRVFAMTEVSFGAHAEQVCIDANGVVAHIPEGLDFDQVAALPTGGLAALGYLRMGGIAPKKRVLVRGALGSIGSFAVQLAAHHFDAEVTGLCGADDVDEVLALGAVEALDYTKHPFPDPARRYDLVLDVVGKVPLGRCLAALNDDGRYVRATVPSLWELLVALWVRLTSRKRILLGDAGSNAADLAMLGRLVADGVLRTVVDSRFPLENAIDAHRVVDTGHKKGNVLLDVQPPGETVSSAVSKTTDSGR